MKTHQKFIAFLSGTLLAVTLTSLPAHASVSKTWLNDTCGSSTIWVNTGAVGYHGAKAWRKGDHLLKTVNYGWVDYPNPYRKWNTNFYSTIEIYTVTSVAWASSPYLSCW